MTENKNDLGGHVPHGGRHDLEPAAPDAASHVGASEIETVSTYDKQHLPGCRKVMYDAKSSPCTCLLEWERLVGGISGDEEICERYRAEANDLREIAQDLHEFQLRYETNTYQPGHMPGNELYGKQLMGIVGAARRALMKHENSLRMVRCVAQSETGNQAAQEQAVELGAQRHDRTSTSEIS